MYIKVLHINVNFLSDSNKTKNIYQTKYRYFQLYHEVIGDKKQKELP